MEQGEPLKLNLGAGAQAIPGYENIDRATGKEVFPLEYPDGVAEEIRASHVLEHFSHTNTGNVIKDWARVLKPGGVLKVAVPDFDWIVDQYRSPNDKVPVEGYLMGAHSDANDLHGAIFNRRKLTTLLKAAGLVNVQPWYSEIQDCATLAVSLNLMATKPTPERAVEIEAARPKRVVALMSAPRLAFMDNYFTSFRALLKLRIEFRRYGGVFWGQALEQGILQAIADGYDTILAMDYDTIFDSDDVEQLLGILADYPEVDAVAPVQSSRRLELPMVTVVGADGKPLTQIPADNLMAEIMPVASAHFGLTAIRVKAIQGMTPPWFRGEPGVDGHWGEGRRDPDIWFWREFAKAGKKLVMANRVAIGHLELMVRWPGKDMRVIFQHPNDYFEKGKASGVWK